MKEKKSFKKIFLWNHPETVTKHFVIYTQITFFAVRSPKQNAPNVWRF